MTRLLDQILIYLLAASLVFGGWNWWRKNVYYTALNEVAAAKVEQARQAEKAQATKLSEQAEWLKEHYRVREDALHDQLAEIMRVPPAERVVYRLRDKWLPVSCPAAPSSGGDEVVSGGLQPEDEQFLVRFAADADNVALTLASCQAAVETLTKPTK